VFDAKAAVQAILAGKNEAREFESDLVDFKEPAREDGETVRILVDTALCFANASGGTIVLGVADRGSGPDALRDTDLDAAFVRKRIYDLTEPPLLVGVTAFEVEEHRLLRVDVPESPEIHADQKGRAPRRVGTDCRPMSPTEQKLLREDRQGIDWSGQPSKRRRDEVTDRALEAARDRLGRFSDSRRELADLSDEDLLRALGVLDGQGRLLRAAAVLLCPPQHATGHLLYQYRPTPGSEPSTVERLEIPGLLAFNRSLELIEARRQLTALNLPDGQQIQLEDFPQLAVREAIANALIHRDYRVDGQVVIDHSPEVLAISSPGPLVSGITPANILTHPSKARNPLLARVARQLGLAEEVGRGVDRMYREMLRTGRDVPTIESTDHVRLTLVGGAPNTQIARYLATLPEAEREDVDTLLVVATLCERRTINAAQISPTMQKGADEAEVILRRLSGDHVGMLEPTRESARWSSPNYRLRSDVLSALGTAVSYKRRTTDEIDRKVIEHVREYGKVTNRTVRNLLDVQVNRAAAILGDLVDREVLRKTSEAQRGPSVEYGPGPQFPSSSRKRSPRTSRSR